LAKEKVNEKSGKYADELLNSSRKISSINSEIVSEIAKKLGQNEKIVQELNNELEALRESSKNKADLNVTLIFTNDEDEKKGFVRVNGIKFEINTEDDSFNRKVNPHIRRGNNAIEIVPVSEKLDILELDVLMAE